MACKWQPKENQYGYINKDKIDFKVKITDTDVKGTSQ